MISKVPNIDFNIIRLCACMDCENTHRLTAYMYQEYISIESMQLPETAFLHIDVTSNSANPISGGVVV